jgi:hypothetical protein
MSSRMPIPRLQDHAAPHAADTEDPPNAEYIKALVGGRYGTALKAFIILADLTEPIAQSARSNVLPTFNAVCDLALNPPVPPMVMSAPPGRSRWSWSEIYPPLRFCLAAQQVKRIGLMCTDQNVSQITSYQAKLADACGWPDPSSYRYSHLASDKIRSAFDGDAYAEPEIDYHRYCSGHRKRYGNSGLTSRRL